MSIKIFLYAITAYVGLCKLWPYFLYPNYAKKSRIETYSDIKKLAVNLKGDDKISTVENVYTYMKRTYAGRESVLRVNSLLTVFHVGDFGTEKVLGQKQFLWCHNQNRIFKSLLINTGLFVEEDVEVHRRFFSSFFIHQWIVVFVDGKKITVDPYYNIYESV